MNKNQNFGKEQMEALLNMAAKSTGTTKDKLMDNINKGNLEDFAMKNLDTNKAKQLKQILSNKDAAKELLETPEARNLLQKLLEGKNNG